MNFIILGSPSVGKTCWINKIINNNFYIDKYIPTLKTNIIEFNYKENQITCIDIPGTNIDTYIDQNSFKKINGIFFMCEVNGKDLPYIKTWKYKVDQKSNIKSILIINKLDIDVEEDIAFDSFCKDNNINTLHAISVIDNHDIYEPLDKMIEYIQNDNNVNPNESNIFIRNLMIETEKCVTNDIIFKIKYIILLTNNNHIKITMNQLLLDLKDFFLKNVPINDILNYIINLY